MTAPRSEPRRLVALLALLAWSAGCTAKLQAPGGGAGGSPSVGGGATGGAPGSTEDCSGPDAVSAKRVVRLSFNQIANSLGSLVDSALGTQITEEFELLDAQHRAFPPLQSPREGNSFTDQSWSAADQI